MQPSQVIAPPLLSYGELRLGHPRCPYKHSALFIRIGGRPCTLPMSAVHGVFVGCPCSCSWYIIQLGYSLLVGRMLEVPVVPLLPSFVTRWRVIEPMMFQAKGTLGVPLR